MKILIVEDEPLMGKLMMNILKMLPGISEVTLADGYHQGLQFFNEGHFQMAIIDIHLGDFDYNGIDLCKKIREKSSDIPLIVITADHSIESMEKAFNAYINDYIRKPFTEEELKIRVKRWLYDYQTEGRLIIRYNQLTFKSKANEFFYNQKPLLLSKKNKELLLLFLKNPETLLTQKQIKENLWSDRNPFEKNRNVRSNVQILRKSLKPFGCETWINTIRGEGYILKNK